LQYFCRRHFYSPLITTRIVYKKGFQKNITTRIGDKKGFQKPITTGIVYQYGFTISE